MNILGDLRRLNALHQNLLALGRVAVALLDQNNLEALEDVWTKRRRLFRELEVLNKRLEPHFKGWDQEPESPAQKLVDQAAVKGEAVLSIDRQLRDKLNEKKNEAGKQMARLKKGEKLVRAYRPIPAGPGLPDKISRTG